ncbi:MAG: hypothetical protein ACOYXR_03355 [Nitrospirota bacterium]
MLRFLRELLRAAILDLRESESFRSVFLFVLTIAILAGISWLNFKIPLIKNWLGGIMDKAGTEALTNADAVMGVLFVGLEIAVAVSLAHWILSVVGWKGEDPLDISPKK